MVWVNLPRLDAVQGHVQAGRRPAVVLHASESLDTIPAIIVVVGTGKLAALRFPHTVRVDPDNGNGLAKATVFMGFQTQAVDRNWLEEPRLGRLSEESLRRVENIVLEALGFDPPNE